MYNITPGLAFFRPVDPIPGLYYEAQRLPSPPFEAPNLPNYWNWHALYK